MWQNVGLPFPALLDIAQCCLLSSCKTSVSGVTYSVVYNHYFPLNINAVLEMSEYDSDDQDFAVYSDEDSSDEPQTEWPFPIPTSASTISACGSKLIVIGGWNGRWVDDITNSQDGGYVRRIYSYNIYTNKWQNLKWSSQGETDPPLETASHRTFALSPSELLVFGGSLSPRGIMGCSNELYIYSVKSEEWRKLECSGDGNSIPAVDVGHWWGRAAFMSNNVLYVSTGNYELGSMEIHELDLSKEVPSWKILEAATPSLGVKVKQQMIVYANKIYLFGGRTWFDSFLPDTEQDSLLDIPTFDLLSHEWFITKCTGDIEEVKFMFAPCVELIDRFIYLTGGKVFADRQEHLSNLVLKLDLETKHWTKYAAMKVGRFFHASCVSEDGRLFVYGGCAKIYYNGRRTNSLEYFQVCVPSLYQCALRAFCCCEYGVRVASLLGSGHTLPDSVVSFVPKSILKEMN
ncbi:hypothetical protein AB6A40_000962 [Gnathostoma spinigerum]|uniref:Uncharacterized protein n=1 Tax=Gnathostoma spinigerum TaxID=75299 RepID=A0ABD6E394_9BILA